MIITIDLNNPKPTYQQIVECIRRAIAGGSLKPGDQLPTIREAAIQARVNRNTISRAYLELEHLGLVQSRQGSGCFITENGMQVEKNERLRIIQRMAEELALEALHFDISKGELTDIVQKSMESLASSESLKESSDE